MKTGGGGETGRESATTRTMAEREEGRKAVAGAMAVSVADPKVTAAEMVKSAREEGDPKAAAVKMENVARAVAARVSTAKRS